jgi:hypothetical protein
MSMINEIACTEVFANTGFGQCNFSPREIFGILLVNPDFVIKDTDTATLQTFLTNAARNINKGLRLRPIMGFVEAEDSSEEPVRQTFGYGATKTLRDGNYNWQFKFVNGGTCLLKSLQALNGQTPYVIFVDAAYNLIGTVKDGGLGGIPVTDYWANPWNLNDGSGVATLFSIYLSFAPTYINQRLAFIQTSTIPNFDISGVRGVQDVLLNVTASSASSISVQLKDKCTGSLDFGALYSDELEDPSAWVATTTLGVAQVIDTVVYNAATKTFVLTFDPVRAAATILNLADISALIGLGVIGYEGIPVTVEAP